MNDLESQFHQQIAEYLLTIESRVEEIFKEAIQISIYSYFTPVKYIRTNTFLNSVNSHIDIDSGIMYVYVDLNEGDIYYSAVTNESQFQNIAKWLESGHTDNTGYDGQYHQYEQRDYLETAKKLINAEFPGLIIDIIGN